MTAVEHRFGPYGGQFVPETLMPALAELEAAWVDARADAGFQADLARLLRDYAGRPTPLYEARRLSERAGRPIYLKREDLLHTGAHKINNALGQALLTAFKHTMPWGLAGGLTPATVADAIRATGAALVDTSSGVESAPGVKDHRQLKRLFDSSREAAVRHRTTSTQS